MMTIRIYLLLLGLCPLFLMAQRPGEPVVRVYPDGEQSWVLEMDLSAPAFRTVQTPSGPAVIPQLIGGQPHLVAGEPDLPHLTRIFQVPPGTRLRWVVEASTVETYRDIWVAPSKGNLSRQVDPATVPYVQGKAYSQSGSFPGHWVQAQALYRQRDLQGQALWLYPYQYNAAARELQVCTRLVVRVVAESDAAASPAGPELPRTGRGFEQLFRRSLVNYQGVPSRSGGEQPERLLVVAPDDLVATLAPLVQWKQQSGWHTTVVPLSQWGEATPANIYNGIRGDYLAGGTDMVLLVGDEFLLPTVMRNNGGGWYSCDNCYGYMDEDDHVLDVLVGRLHASNPAQLAMMIARVLEYEKQPLIDEGQNWMAIGMASASDEGAGFGDDGQSDYEHANEWKAAHLEDGFDAYWEYYDGTQGDYSPTPGHPSADQPGSPQNGPLVDRMNTSGVTLYNYTGHGWEQGLASGNFNTDAVAALRNDGRYPILIAVACCTGNFTNNNSGDCLGEAWQRAGDAATGQPWGGIAGFFSSDFQSWSPPMEGQDAMNQYLVDADGIALLPTIGGMAAFGFATMIGSYGWGGEVMADYWNPFADPTTIPRTAMPVEIPVFHDTTLVAGATSLLVQCPVEGARVALAGKDQVLAVAYVQGGTAELIFDPLEVLGPHTLTVVQFNHLPYQGKVVVLPPLGPFVVWDDLEIDDSAGNGNGRPEYGEFLALNIVVGNVGQTPATQTRLELISLSPWLQVLLAEAELGTLDPGIPVMLPGVFTLEVAPDVPHGSTAVLELRITHNDTLTRSSLIPLMLYAPLLRIPDPRWTDASPGGNGNKRMENGETLSFVWAGENIGSALTPAMAASWQVDVPWVTLGPTGPLNPLAAGGSAELAVELEIAPDAPVYGAFYLTFALEAGAYRAEKTVGPYYVNPIVDDFESAGFEAFPWLETPVFPWEVTTEMPYWGQYCVQSADIADQQISELRLRLQVLEDGFIGFARRVSTEEGWDFLRFYIDGEEQAQWSGEADWEEFRFPVQAGERTFLWRYQKDEIYDGGQDRAWLDDIWLPVHEVLSSLEEESLAAWPWTIAPNPGAGWFRLQWDAPDQSPLRLQVLNSQGQVVWAASSLAPGQTWLDIDLQASPPGMYLVQVLSGNTMQQKKIILTR